MDSTGPPQRRFDSLMLTDQRSPDEAVTLIRLPLSREEQLSFERSGCLIIGALHMFKGPGGLLFDVASTPEVLDAAGKPARTLTLDHLPEAVRAGLEQTRARLRFRSTEGRASLPPDIVDQLRIFVFDTAGAPVTLEWRVIYADKTYPLVQPRAR